MDIKRELLGRLESIRMPDFVAQQKAWERWDSLGKPLRSLGKLEKNIVKIAAISGNEEIHLDKRGIVVMCGDHGVVAEGVTQTDSSVTRTVAENMTRGMASINILAHQADADVYVIDVGMDCEASGHRDLEKGLIVDRKVRRGTGNIAREAAMTMEECMEAVLAGMDVMAELDKKGYQIIGIGEMGIGNTTPSSALTAQILNLSPAYVTGRGAGLSDEGLDRKVRAIEMALERYQKEAQILTAADAACFEIESTLEIMAQLGGLELAGMTGLILGGALCRIPVLLDGFISEAAALCASAMIPWITEWMIGSHISTEPAARQLSDYLKLEPMIDAGLCLGEGTGAAMAMSLLDFGLAEYENMFTFEEISVKAYEHLSEDK